VDDFAFTSAADGDSEIYLYRARDRSIQQLTDNDAQDHWASWSPDGQALAFQSLRDGNREIYVRDMATGETRNITNNAEQDLLPAWSPNGARIAFASSRDKPWPLEGPLGGHNFLVDPDGSHVQRLETPDLFSTSGIAWAPDGRAIAYSRFGQGVEGIYLFEFGTGAERRVLTIEGAAPGVAAFSPVGDSILFYLESGVGSDLYTLSLADGQYAAITSDGHHYYASWSADGAALLTTTAQPSNPNRFDINCISLDGAVNVPVIDDTSDARSASWRPTAPRANAPY
jgi:TolB protein